MLLFKKKFLDAIRDGRKTQTVRLWRVCRFRAGQRSYVPGVGYIRITVIDQVRLEELTDEDAVLDGFASAAALLAEIHQLYEDRIKAGYQAYRIRFERMSEAESTAVRERKSVAKKAVVKTTAQNPSDVQPPPLRLHQVRAFKTASSRQNPE